MAILIKSRRLRGHSELADPLLQARSTQTSVAGTKLAREKDESEQFQELSGGADGTRTRAKSNKISKLLNHKGSKSPFDPYDPQILHQISHYLLGTS